MNRFLLALLASALPLATFGSYADNIHLPTGFYVSGEGAYAFMFTPNSSMNSAGGSYSRGGFGFGANVGYNWQLDSFSVAGLELGYNDNGQSKYTASGASGDTGSLTFASKSLDLLGTFSTFWNNGVFLIAKAGVAYVKQTQDLLAPVIINGNSFTSSQSISDNNFEPMAVLGLGYQLTNNLSLLTELSYIAGDNSSRFTYVTNNTSFDNDSAAILSARVGLMYNF